MKSFKIKLITKEDTLIFKAIGIILIALHNYFRWVKPITGENEFGMSGGYAINSYQTLLNNPLEVINVFFNFLGHYGVQIFIFISAYGLTKVYLSKSIEWRLFVRKRFLKLYPTILLATFAMIIFNVAGHGNLPNKKLLIDFAAQLSLLSTFIPGKALVGVGPWWFYSMIFQFYLIFPGLLWIYKKYKGQGLIILSIVFYMLLIFVNPMLRPLKLNLLNTAFGHIPEFCFGIWVASRKEFKINILVYILAFIVFILGNYFRPVWHFSHLAAIVVILPLVQYLITKIKLNDFINKIVSFIGLVSVYIFAVHGFLRWDFVGLANFLNYPIAEFLVGIMFLIFSIGMAWLLFNVENQIRLWIKVPDDIKNRNFRFILLFILMAGLVISVKSCESINYAKKKKQGAELKEVVEKKQVIDFEEKINEKYTVIDSLAFNGNKSCLITSKKEYGPVIRVDLKEWDIEKLKTIKVSCALFQSNNSTDKIHIVLEYKNLKSKVRLGWYNKTFEGVDYKDHWCIKEFDFGIDQASILKDSFVVVYIWNNSNDYIIIDDFSVEIISN
jgi:peptidoglycan/LPS O-acetylase OafA/YrhL